jgi:hypothetical protein
MRREELSEKLIAFALNNWSYETEYAGRVETWCFFCNTEQYRGEKHAAGCLHVKAKELQEPQVNPAPDQRSLSELEQKE